MEDQPSTSKDVGNRDDPDDDKDEESRDDQGTNSGSSLSAYSIKSRLDMAANGPEIPKPALGKPETKSEEKKKRKKRVSGRVDKRKKPPTRRQVIRRAPRRKPRARVEKKRDLSVSTIYSRLSSSGLLTPGCERCGHRCCRRR
ncbi:unnamed protein product [Colias eurytheme]|nr:unnamed protein product [Colias eurytheme]